MLTYMLANLSFMNNEVPVMLACPFFYEEEDNEVNLEIGITYISRLTGNDDLHIIRLLVVPYL